MRTLRNKATTGVKTEAVVISKTELDRMRGAAVIVSNDQKRQQKQIFEEQKDQQLAAAKARKQKMMELDKTRGAKVPLTHQQKFDKDKQETLLTKAMEKLDEEQDDVKHMNQMMLYSKVVTIRDRQLEE